MVHGDASLPERQSGVSELARLCLAKDLPLIQGAHLGDSRRGRMAVGRETAGLHLGAVLQHSKHSKGNCCTLSIGSFVFRSCVESFPLVQIPAMHARCFDFSASEGVVVLSHKLNTVTYRIEKVESMNFPCIRFCTRRDDL